MRFIPNGLSTKLYRQALVLQKHSPNILFGVGVVGVVGTAVLASKATLGLEAVLDEHEKNVAKVAQAKNLDNIKYDEDAQQRDMVVIHVKTGLSVARLYAPAVGLGIISIACLTKSHNILSERNVALTAAYATLEKGFGKYRERVVAAFGEDKERELRYGVEEKETISETKQGHKVTVSRHADREAVAKGYSIYARLFDELNPSWVQNPDYNFVFLKARQHYANDLFNSKGHLFLNEVYDMLDITRTPEGAVVGWLKGEGDDYVDFGLFDDRPSAKDFISGLEASVLLDFNVAGTIYDKI